MTREACLFFSLAALTASSWGPERSPEASHIPKKVVEVSLMRSVGEPYSWAYYIISPYSPLFSPYFRLFFPYVFLSVSLISPSDIP